MEYATVFNQALYIWVVQPSGNIEFRSVELAGDDTSALVRVINIDGSAYRDASPSELDTLITDTRTATINVVSTAPNNLQTLHTLLIDPIADLLPTDFTTKVALIPHSTLFHVPFSALQDTDGTYLIEKHTILGAPSIQVLGLAHEAVKAQKTPTNPSKLIVGNSVMPQVIIPDANSEFINSQLATLPRAEAEAEIYNMNLQAELAILSACDTGRGHITRDGVVGLSRSFITAGAPSVIVFRQIQLLIVVRLDRLLSLLGWDARIGSWRGWWGRGCIRVGWRVRRP